MWLKLKTIVAKGEIAHYEQYHLWPQCFKSRLLQSCQKASVYGKGKGKMHLSTVKTRTMVRVPSLSLYIYFSPRCMIERKSRTIAPLV